MQETDQVEERPEKQRKRARFSPISLAVVIGVTVLAVALSGCGGSDDSSDGDSDQPSATATTPADNSGGAGGTGGDGGDGDGSGGSGGDGGDSDGSDGSGGSGGDASSDLLTALGQATQSFDGVTRYQVEFRVQTPGQEELAGFIRVDGLNSHISFGEFEAISVDGSAYLNAGGVWQELPGAAGAGVLASAPFSPNFIAENLDDLNIGDLSGVEITSRGLVDVPGGACNAYTILVEGQGGVTYCLRESNGELAQIVAGDATSTITMTFTYEDMAVTAP